MRKPRLGHTDFINCLPLTYSLTEAGFNNGLEVRFGVPAVLNGLIVDKELDVSAVSSIIYAKYPDRFLIMPDASISADGALRSILLVAKRPIEELTDALIALTAKSATSHGLLKIIMHYAYKAAPEYNVTPLTLDNGALENADAVLFIGDDALCAYHNRIDGYYYYDLGAEWKKLTGKMMVYSVWIVEREFAAQYPEQVRLIYERITGGFAYGLTHLEDAINTLGGHAQLNAGQIREYLGFLDYQLTPEHLEALLTYYRMAHSLGLIDVVPELEFAEVRA